MWPFIPASEIDWSVTVASLSALVAAGALVWNMWWSHKILRRDALAKIAGHRVSWMENMRRMMVDFDAAVYKYDFTDGKDTEALFLINKLNQEIIISFNPDEKENLQFFQTLNELLKAGVSDEKDREKRSKKLIEASSNFRDEGRLLLKREWDKVKMELRGVE